MGKGHESFLIPIHAGKELLVDIFTDFVKK